MIIMGLHPKSYPRYGYPRYEYSPSNDVLLLTNSKAEAVALLMPSRVAVRMSITCPTLSQPGRRIFAVTPWIKTKRRIEAN